MIAVYITIAFLVGMVIMGAIGLWYVGNLDYLIDHITIHFDNGCIYNGEMLVCTNKGAMP